MTTNSTGYSPHPKNYDDSMSNRDAEIVFGRRHNDPDLSAPNGNVDTKAFSTTERLWSGSNGTIGLTPDPKLSKPRGAIGSDTRPDIDGGHMPNHTDPFAKHNVLYSTTGYNSFPEDWRAAATGPIETAWCHNTDPTFVTKDPVTTAIHIGPAERIPAGAANSVAMKFDSGKTDWSLMPFEAIEEINKVLDFGAKKYAAHNWKTGSGFKYTRVLSSLLRHTFAWARGEDLDPESGLSHLAHMGCNVVFLIYYNKYNARYSNDDRVTR